MGWPSLLAGFTLLGLGLAGCAGTPPTGRGPDPAATLPAGVTVELVQLRADVAPRHAQVHVTNGSDEALTIGEVRVEDPRFDGAAARVVADRTSTLSAGRSVDVRVQLPGVDCSAPGDARPEVVLEIVSDSGSAEVTASATDPLGFIAPLHERECRAQRLTDAASLAFTGFRESPPGAPAALELTVTPTGDAGATVVGVQTTNLLDFGPSTIGRVYPLDLVVAPGEQTPTVVELPLVPSRCDPHAVQEDKRGTIFSVPVVVDGEPGEIELFVGEDMRGRILSWVAEWCGFG
ncbi:hypothetical protein K0817_004050 [Microbacterium sp. HD4P20]|uniref:hypothetical protein n=1 Tax=Microbacterium sp. HD4P20 TaxID=2864874 RepID=UPI0020A41C7B|nr:hypothetical protein [Microbacterium sp. HD4P20]MCP2635737.1 hypothetical protein [Microbacterium sp. HD4P20]